MAKVLILSASTGHGHNQAAKCLKSELEASGYTVSIVEPVKEESKFMEKLVDDGYQLLASRLPKMYGKLYKITYHKYVNKGVVTFLNLTLSTTIFQLIQEHTPDLLIVTHPLFVNVVSLLKADGKIDLPFIAIVTDYMAHLFYVNKYVDAYIVGSRYTKDTLTEKGVSADKIYAYGIPIRKEFRQPRREHKDNTFTILLMGGGMGVPYMRKCLEKLLINKHNFRLLVVCGNNQKLKTSLENKLAGLTTGGKEIKIYGFTPNIADLMDESDVIVTKPGGLTVTEAINKNIPIIIPFFIPGQEEENTEILVRAGLAVRVSDTKELNQLIDRFVENPNLLLNMRQRAKELSRELSPDSIIQLTDRLIFNHKLSREKNVQLV
ncbi:MAG: MGDG synthase family glycosyltransferase [Desulfitobacteriia bacterium]|jgi:processive 1,2-diacylglycerol beta-glucosyltransferase